MIALGLILTKNVLCRLTCVGLHILCKMEGVGFEPTQPVRAADLQSAPINHSGTPPWPNSIKKC